MLPAQQSQELSQNSLEELYKALELQAARERLRQQTYKPSSPQNAPAGGGGSMPSPAMIQQFMPSSAGGAGSAGTGASGGGSALASAGPWAALAAAIIGNESYAKDHGYRKDDKYLGQTALEGRALWEDVSQRWGPKLDKISPMFGDSARIGAFFGSPADMFKSASRAEVGEALKNSLQPWKWF